MTHSDDRQADSDDVEDVIRNSAGFVGMSDRRVIAIETALERFAKTGQQQHRQPH